MLDQRSLRMDAASAFMLTTMRPAIEKAGLTPLNGPPTGRFTTLSSEHLRHRGD